MKTIVVYPGRFHPFHKGHKASYDHLVNQYGADSVYIATSDVQAPETSPFSYADKVKMMTKLGIPASHIVKVKNPYQPKEIIADVADPGATALIFAVSAKDMQKEGARFKFGLKKDGTPSYLQPLDGAKKLQPLTQHAYVAVTPTVNFRVAGVDADSASAIRKMYLHGNDNDRNQIIADLYGEVDPELKELFDERLGVNTPENIVTYGAPIIDGGTVEAGMRESRQAKLNKLSERIRQLKQLIKEHRTTPINPDYIDEKISR